jgi:hypothetical protein
MRHLIFGSLLFVFCLFNNSAGQNFSSECGMPEEPDAPESYAPPTHFVGRHITSSGTLRVLVVFIRFAGDTETTPVWPDTAVLPAWAQNLVNTNYSPTGNYYPGTASHFFHQNSYGNLHVIGDVYYVTTDSTEDYFHQYASSNDEIAARGIIEMEALDKLDSAPYNVDFSIYDNWNRVSNYTVIPNTPTVKDDEVDMIWFITRNIDKNPPIGNFYTDHAKLDCITHDRDGKTIRGRSFPGSGIGMFSNRIYHSVNSSQEPYGTYSIVNLLAHEMTHYFFGSGHFSLWDNQLASRRYGADLKSYVGGWRSAYSGYEKWRLGWLTPKTITVSGDNYILYDLATTMNEPPGATNGRLYKIDIPGTDQYYLIENRSWTSPFEARHNADSGIHGLLKPGILIYHIIRDDERLPFVDTQKGQADGRFIWEMVYHGSNNGGDGRDDFIKKGLADRENGYSETERIFIDAIPSAQYWSATWHPDPSNPYGGGPYENTYSHGGVHETTDLTGDSLDIYHVGDVLTPWSNTASHKWNGSAFEATNIGVEVSSYNSTNKQYTLKVRLSNPEQLSPSRPQDLEIETSANYHPLLTWSSNLEPDVNNKFNRGKYKVYRTVFENDPNYPYVEVGQVNHVFHSSTQTFEDLSVNIPRPGDIRPMLRYYYKVSAVDNTQKESVKSEQASILAKGYIPYKTNTGQDVEEIKEFGLAQNYPNPFNPETIIKYQIPASGFVQLKVYNVLGKEVATLINRDQEQGSYSVPFDASKLAAGVYIYSIRVNDFSKSHKMLLLK